MLLLQQVIIKMYHLNNMSILNIFQFKIIKKMFQDINIIINNLVLLGSVIIKIYQLNDMYILGTFLLKIINKMFQDINLMRHNLAKRMKIKLEAILKITFPRIKSRINNIIKLVKSEMTKL